MMDNFTVTLKNALMRYNGRTVLDIPELTFEAGCRCALIGSNGSGKTTLLRLIAGAIQPTGGTIRMSGIDAGGIAYLPQKPYAFSLSALKSLTMTGVDAGTAQRALSSVGLDSLAHEKCNKLSGGEAQRLAVIRLLLKPYKLLLLDEPTSAADISACAVIEEVIAGYCRKTGCGLIFATHSLSQAERASDTLLFLDSGRILEQGPTVSVLSSPRTPELRAFTEYWNR